MPAATKRKPVKRRDRVPAKEKASFHTKFDPIFLVHIYRFARMGMADETISQAIAVSYSGFKKWKRTRKDVVEALELGRKEAVQTESFAEFFYYRLKPEVRAVWDRLCEWDRLPDGVAKAEALLEDHGRAIRQQLFVHALIYYNFSRTKAEAKVCVDHKTVEEWCEKDPDFAELVRQVQTQKGDFFEEGLVKLVEKGDTTATIFANKTFNRGRGYAVSSDVNVNYNGRVGLDHTVTLDLTTLGLPPEILSTVMDAIRVQDERVENERRISQLPAENRFLREISSEIGGVSEPVFVETGLAGGEDLP